MKNIRVTSRFAIFIALLLISMLGAILVLQATPEGAGLSDDSIAYVAGARSIVAGQGYREAWLASNQPVTHFPPGFSAVLAVLVSSASIRCMQPAGSMHFYFL